MHSNFFNSKFLITLKRQVVSSRVGLGDQSRERNTEEDPAIQRETIKPSAHYPKKVYLLVMRRGAFAGVFHNGLKEQ